MALVDQGRIICALADLQDGGCRGFRIGSGDWLLRGFVVRMGGEVRAYVNRCPHASHPLDLVPDRFLTPDGSLIVCSSHGALFEKHTGRCIAGPCAGQSLRPVPVQVEAGYVVIAPGVDVEALADD